MPTSPLTTSPIQHRTPHFAVDIQTMRRNGRGEQAKAWPKEEGQKKRDAWVEQQIQAFDGDAAKAASLYWKKEPLLVAAVCTEREDWVAQVLGWGLPLELTDDLKRTALHHAVQRESTGIVQRLLNAGANLQAQDGNHNTPLHFAAQVNWENHVALLIEQGADLEATTLLDHTTPLVDAARMSLESAGVLLARGANVNAQSKHGETPLIAALVGGNPQAVPVLLAHGADPNHVDGQGFPVLWHALLRTEHLTHPDHNSFDVLLAAGADPHARPPEGKTLMHVAAEQGRLEHLLTLLRLGVDPLAVDGQGQTPQVLLRQHHPDLSEPFRLAVLDHQLPAALPARRGPRF